MQIFVRTLLSKTVTIDVESTETISSLLAKLELHHGCEGDAADGQRLIFGGKQLENDKTVAEYEIQKGSTIHTVGQILGGAKPETKIAPALLALARKYMHNKRVCRKCYARLDKRAVNCRKKKCGHSNQLREKKMPKKD